MAMAAFASICADWTETHAQTRRQPRELFIASGLVHITMGQSVQLNVSWAPIPDDSQPIPDDNRPAAVKLMIFDSAGVVVAQSVERLARGRTASLTLNRDLLARTEARLGLRAVARVSSPIPDDGSPVPDDSVVGSFEVVDNRTQRTMFVSPVAPQGFDPQPDPPATRQWCCYQIAQRRVPSAGGH